MQNSPFIRDTLLCVLVKKKTMCVNLHGQYAVTLNGLMQFTIIEPISLFLLRGSSLHILPQHFPSQHQEFQ